MPQSADIDRVRVVLPAFELTATVAFFERLGFAIHSVCPADAPREISVVGHGLELVLDRTASGSPGQLQLMTNGDERGTLTAPNGTTLTWVPATPDLVMPAPAPLLVVSQPTAEAAWNVGRAQMQYRDLIPGRQGGRFIASHIRIPNGGPVPDWVHFHRVHYQLIFILKGWVRVVYEHQGPPFVMHAHDCVLQPRQIRHRVLECSDGLEVLEIGCPAEHDTLADPTMALPTADIRADRVFDGQRFVCAQAVGARWADVAAGTRRDLGLASATDGLIDGALVRVRDLHRHTPCPELRFWFGLKGEGVLRVDGAEHPLGPGTAVAVPGNATAEVVGAISLFELRV
jgi:quercetin dioxygenase-like cupin family protein